MDKHVITLLLLFACLNFAHNKILTIDLVRHRSAHHNKLILDHIKGGSNLGLQTDWKSENFFDFGKNVTNRTTISLYRYLDNEFYGQIKVGSKHRSFNLIVDTAWRTSWIISVNCPSTTIGCWFKNKYDHIKSDTYKPDGAKFIINQGSYNLTGTYSYDQFLIGDKTVKKQRFVEMENVPNSFIFTKSDGVLGLSPSSEDKTFFENLLEQGSILKPIFSIYLNRDRLSNRGGSITIGFYDTKFIHKTNKVFDEITYVDVIDSEFWKIRMNGVYLTQAKKTTDICTKNCLAILDSSGTSIFGPSAYIEKINKLIGARKTLYGKYEVDCDTVNKLPTITFEINGNNFNLTGKQYVQKVSISAYQACISAFNGPSTNLENENWLIGGAFLAEYYTIYDLDKMQVGLVKAA